MRFFCSSPLKDWLEFSSLKVVGVAVGLNFQGEYLGGSE